MDKSKPNACERKLLHSYSLLPVAPHTADEIRAKFLAEHPDLKKAWEMYCGKKQSNTGE